MPITEFTGVSTAAGRGIEAPGGPYEFDTEQGAHIYLHDTELTRLGYEVGPPSVLELHFVYDPARTPIVVLRFEGVHILEWRHTPAPPEAPLGQVSTFDWYGADEFMLDTMSVRLEFHARRMHVTVRA
jgi:hypothetical protein